MSVIPMPQRERIPLDPNGFPEGHYAAFQKATERFKDMINELPGPIEYLNIHDAELVLDTVVRDYLRLLPRVR